MTHVTGSQIHTAVYPYTGTRKRANTTFPANSKVLHKSGETECYIPCSAFLKITRTAMGGIMGILILK